MTSEKLIRRAVELARQMPRDGAPPAGEGALLAGLIVASSLDLLTAEVRALRSQVQKLREAAAANPASTEGLKANL